MTTKIPKGDNPKEIDLGKLAGGFNESIAIILADIPIRNLRLFLQTSKGSKR